ncbi:hypothetical protein CMV30_06395 [Nibricoccus aquaticus]|uniref:Uncharacterized protein n=1 Tax=Nibricoccus aquaticus TaxID=2576891 RepID=A0A290Q8V0_9BACT|nr:hypothetical protein CMV30_06395 [Nibricoccus aquaticus]
MADEGAIRVVFNRWCGPVQFLDQDARMREQAERDELYQALCRLIAISRLHTAGISDRKVRAGDVERVITCFRRLALMWKVRPSEIASYCETRAANDDNVLAHIADPLQLRYILTFHTDVPGAVVTAGDLARLRGSCVAGDQQGMRAWFDEMGEKKDVLPKDTPQALRYLLLQLWNAGVGDLETLAYELAVLDTRMFDAMGWENTRMFCALLKRIGGGRYPAFGAYISDEDIDEALELHQELGNLEQVAHFRALLTVYETKLVRDLERAVFSSAKYGSVVVQPDPEVVAMKKARGSRFLKFFGLGQSAA